MRLNELESKTQIEIDWWENIKKIYNNKRALLCWQRNSVRTRHDPVSYTPPPSSTLLLILILLNTRVPFAQCKIIHIKWTTISENLTLSIEMNHPVGLACAARIDWIGGGLPNKNNHASQLYEHNASDAWVEPIHAAHIHKNRCRIVGTQQTKQIKQMLINRLLHIVHTLQALDKQIRISHTHNTHKWRWELNVQAIKMQWEMLFVICLFFFCLFKCINSDDDEDKTIIIARGSCPFDSDDVTKALRAPAHLFKWQRISTSPNPVLFPLNLME